MGRLALFPKNINLLFMLVGISCKLFFSSAYKGKLNEEKKRLRENCLHVALLNKKNRHQIVNERIDADP